MMFSFFCKGERGERKGEKEKKRKEVRMRV
jgi:hypothetical protein